MAPKGLRWLKLVLLGTGLAAMVGSPCFGQGAAVWNGTWKLNTVRSTLSGTVQHWTVTNDGWWNIEIASIRFAYRCDGRPYTVFQGRTLVCHQLNKRQIDTVVSAGPDLLAHSLRTLSDTDTTMRVDESGKTNDGVSFRKTAVLRRDTPGQGWTGAWREVDVQNGAGDTMVIERGAEAITIRYPASQRQLIARLDGRPAREQGTHATDAEFRLTTLGPRSIQETESEEGKLVERDSMTLSEDGRQLVIESLLTGSQQKQVYVYEKQ